MELKKESKSFQVGYESQVVQPLKPNPSLKNGWPELSYGLVDSNNMNSGICRITSYPAATIPDVKPPREALLHDNRLSFKKKKPDKLPNPKVGAEDDAKEKRIKGNVAEEENSKISEQNSAKNNKESSCAENSRDNSMPNYEVQKPDYMLYGAFDIDNVM